MTIFPDNGERTQPRPAMAKIEFVQSMRPASDEDYLRYRVEAVTPPELYARISYERRVDGSWWIQKISLNQQRAGIGTRLLDAMFAFHPEVREWHLTRMSPEGRLFFAGIAATRPGVTLIKSTGELVEVTETAE